jgi:hypothetical protein
MFVFSAAYPAHHTHTHTYINKKHNNGKKEEKRFHLKQSAPKKKQTKENENGHKK